MKKPRILVTSARNALHYVMRHFSEPGVTEYPEKTDTYAAISIQDTCGGGFGFEFKKNKYCKDLVIGLLTKNGAVEKVLVNGSKSFKKNTFFKYDTDIIVYYHTFKKG